MGEDAEVIKVGVGAGVLVGIIVGVRGGERVKLHPTVKITVIIIKSICFSIVFLRSWIMFIMEYPTTVPCHQSLQK